MKKLVMVFIMVIMMANVAFGAEKSYWRQLTRDEVEYYLNDGCDYDPETETYADENGLVYTIEEDGTMKMDTTKSSCNVGVLTLVFMVHPSMDSAICVYDQDGRDISYAVIK